MDKKEPKVTTMVGLDPMNSLNYLKHLKTIDENVWWMALAVKISIGLSLISTLLFLFMLFLIS